MAPREYVLHGLVLGEYWSRLWPLLASMHLVATPNPVMLFTAVNDNGSSFTLMSPALWVASHYCTSKHHNNNDTWHTLIYITLQLSFMFLLYTFSILQGRLAALCSCCLLQFQFNTLLIYPWTYANNLSIFCQPYNLRSFQCWPLSQLMLNYQIYPKKVMRIKRPYHQVRFVCKCYKWRGLTRGLTKNIWRWIFLWAFED